MIMHKEIESTPVAAEKLHEIERVIKEYASNVDNNAYALGEKLAYVAENSLYQLKGYKSLKQWCEETFETKSRSRFYQLKDYYNCQKHLLEHYDKSVEDIQLTELPITLVASMSKYLKDDEDILAEFINNFSEEYTEIKASGDSEQWTKHDRMKAIKKAGSVATRIEKERIIDRSLPEVIVGNWYLFKPLIAIEGERIKRDSKSEVLAYSNQLVNILEVVEEGQYRVQGMDGGEPDGGIYLEELYESLVYTTKIDLLTKELAVVMNDVVHLQNGISDYLNQLLIAAADKKRGVSSNRVDSDVSNVSGDRKLNEQLLEDVRKKNQELQKVKAASNIQLQAKDSKIKALEKQISMLTTDLSLEAAALHAHV